jgi:hypothetical protein
MRIGKVDGLILGKAQLKAAHILANVVSASTEHCNEILLRISQDIPASSCVYLSSCKVPKGRYRADSETRISNSFVGNRRGW